MQNSVAITMRVLLFLFFIVAIQFGFAQENRVKILNFYGDNGYEHASKKEAQKMLGTLGEINNWEIVSTDSASIFNLKEIFSFDVVIFNNNCGNEGRILSIDQQQALQQYIRNGGGFVGIHCAGAIWHEEGQFQQWYEKLIGTKLVAHPPVQKAKLIVENPSHPITRHLPLEWNLTDEWHQFAYNPRESVNVLISLDEDSYEGKEKMGGDHPFTWYQYYDGGRSFFTSLGHTIEIYNNKNFRKLITEGIYWAIGKKFEKQLPITNGLLLDLDANYGIRIEEGNKISSWSNHVMDDKIGSFYKQDEGRSVKGSGRPRLVLNNAKINGHNSVIFHRTELVSDKEDAFDHLIKGSGHTWFSVMAVYEQVPDLPGVSSFFGNLKNGGKYEGIWAGLSDNNQLWIGVRNGITFGRWDENNPQVITPKPLMKNKYYLVMGRMDSGTEKVRLELFLNETKPIAEGLYPVNTGVNPSKMAIGQERDAVQHPGKESFDGEIARFLVYERNLSDKELKKVSTYLLQKYNIK